MSMTIRNVNQIGMPTCVILHTTVDRFEFADNVQANLWELILQQMKE